MPFERKESGLAKRKWLTRWVMRRKEELHLKGAQGGLLRDTDYGIYLNAGIEGWIQLWMGETSIIRGSREVVQVKCGLNVSWWSCLQEASMPGPIPRMRRQGTHRGNEESKSGWGLAEFVNEDTEKIGQAEFHVGRDQLFGCWNQVLSPKRKLWWEWRVSQRTGNWCKVGGSSTSISTGWELLAEAECHTLECGWVRLTVEAWRSSEPGYWCLLK